MPLNPGNNTVTFVSISHTGTVDRLGIPALVETSTVVRGNSMQPISGSDHITNTTYSESTWKCISQATTVTRTIKSEDKLQFNGDDYRILEVKPFYDHWGRLDHLTFFCKEENG